MTTTEQERFNYMMLSRLLDDCDYYFGFGNRNAKHALWAQDEQKHIDKMCELWIGMNEKPVWCPACKIEGYAKAMNVKVTSEKEPKFDCNDVIVNNNDKRKYVVDSVGITGYMIRQFGTVNVRYFLPFESEDNYILRAN